MLGIHVAVASCTKHVGGALSFMYACSDEVDCYNKLAYYHFL